MKALKHTGVYPFFDPTYEWVAVYEKPHGTAMCDDQSVIFVDADIAKELKQNKIELMWATRTNDVQTVRIKSVDGVPAGEILAGGGSYKTLTEMVCGKRGRSRGPTNSFHANDWTRSAFDRDSTEPKTEPTSDDILDVILSHDESSTPSHPFDIPHRSVLDDDIKYMYQNEVSSVLRTRNTDHSLDSLVDDFSMKMEQLLPDTKTRTFNPTPIFITLVVATLSIYWIIA